MEMSLYDVHYRTTLLKSLMLTLRLLSRLSKYVLSVTVLNICAHWKLQSMLAEITDDTNQARAFAFLPATWAIGATVGPLIGGYFSHPAERFPAVFGYEFLRNYPYFLPCKYLQG